MKHCDSAGGRGGSAAQKDGKEKSEREKDRVWGKLHEQNITSTVKKSYDFFIKYNNPFHLAIMSCDLMQMVLRIIITLWMVYIFYLMYLHMNKIRK
mgnify:CR=1 FL=1